MIPAALFIYLALLLYATIGKVRLGRGLDLLPSYFWAVMMAVPFVIQKGTFSPLYVPVHALGVFYFGFLLLAADAWTPRFDERPRASRDGASMLPYLGAIAIVALQTAHLLVMPKIPLLEKWRHTGSRSSEIAMLEAQSKRSNDAQEALLDALGAKRSDPAAMRQALARYAEELSKLRIQEFAGLRPGSPERLRIKPAELAVLDQYAKLVTPLQDNEARLLAERSPAVTAPGDTRAARRAYAAELSQTREREQALYREYYYKAESIQSQELSLLREDSSKLLKVPQPFIYACQTAIILTPVVAFLLYYQGSWILAVVLTLFSLFYSRATLAKGPLLVLLSLYLCVGWAQLSRRTRRILFTGGLAVLLPVAISATLFLTRHPFSILNFRVPEATQEAILKHPLRPIRPGQLTFALTDHYRLLDDFRFQDQYRDVPPLTEYQKQINYFSYRAFLTPVEVSHRWYTFFPDVYGGYLGSYGLTRATRNSPTFQHPSNLVGIWAYMDRFPKYYFKSLHAYASADSDAYSRWGVPGLLVIGLVIFAIRLLLSAVRDQSLAGSCLYYASILLLGINLPQASIQAILVAHGLALFIVLAACVSLRSRLGLGTSSARPSALADRLRSVFSFIAGPTHRPSGES